MSEKPTGFELATLESIAEGDAILQVNHAIQQAIENCLDVNTEAKAKRQVSLKISIAPNEEREAAAISFVVETRLAPDRAKVDRLFFGKHGQGFIQARQMSLSEFENRSNENVENINGEGTNND